MLVLLVLSADIKPLKAYKRSYNLGYPPGKVKNYTKREILFFRVPVRFTIHGILTGTILKSRFFEALFANLAQTNRGNAIAKIHSFSNVPIRLLTNPFLIGTLSRSLMPIASKISSETP